MAANSPLRILQTPNRQDTSLYPSLKNTQKELCNGTLQNENLYPTLPSYETGLASMLGAKAIPHTSETAAALEQHAEKVSSTKYTKLKSSPSPTRPKRALRRESLKTSYSKTSETWTGDDDFFPDSRSPSTVSVPQRALTQQLQSMPVRQNGPERTRIPLVEKWLETLDVAATTPREIEEVDTPPLSPNVEIDRGSMRRWRRKWEAEERNSIADDEDL
jgi:hypothetical protein